MLKVLFRDHRDTGDIHNGVWVEEDGRHYMKSLKKVEWRDAEGGKRIPLQEIEDEIKASEIQNICAFESIDEAKKFIDEKTVPYNENPDWFSRVSLKKTVLHKAMKFTKGFHGALIVHYVVEEENVAG